MQKDLYEWYGTVHQLLAQTAFVEHEVLLKLGIAFLFGCALGLERSLKRKNASLKTAIVLTIASCMVTIVSIESADLFSAAYTKPMDPLRLAAQLINGISFIGAGIILTKNTDAVSGLTTAALMWASVGFGIAIGAGFFMEAFASLLFIMAGVELLPAIIGKIGPKRLSEKQLRLRLQVKKEKSMHEIIDALKEKELRILKVRVKDTDLHPKLECSIAVQEKRYTTDVYDALKSIDGVIAAEVESI